MARKKRTDIEIQRVKVSILKAALDLFDKFEFSELSMRMVARKANCSVATIYNYYPNKDALYLDVLKNGFELLNNSIIMNKQQCPPDNLLKMMSAKFFNFAVQHKNYYNIMFSQPVPRTFDYVGTEMEQASFEVKELALKTLNAVTEVMNNILSRGDIKFSGEPELLAKMFLAINHGVISLYHSRILHELEQDPEGTYRMVIDKFLSFLQKDN
ncbi:MAG: TetR/AcrR family transcriptional regulator [Bacillota bacterium]